MQEVRIPAARDALYNCLQKSGGAPLIQELISRNAKLWLCAGAVRDVIASREFGWGEMRPRDFDVGVAGLSKKTFHGLLAAFGGEQNRYGGYRIHLEGSPPWEVWRLEETIGLRLTRAPFSVKNVLRTFVLSTNAIAFSIETGRFWDKGALRSIATRTARLVEDAILHSTSVFAAKALFCTIQFPFMLSPELQSFVSTHLEAKRLTHEAFKNFRNFTLLNTKNRFHLANVPNRSRS